MRRTLIAATGLLFVAGCWGSEVELGTVTGRVTMDGKPLPDALVEFVPTAGGRSSQGRTDADGRYKLDYTAREAGALVGPAKVAIMTGNLEDPKHRDETVPLRYNYETTLVKEVESGHNEFDFELESK